MKRLVLIATVVAAIAAMLVVGVAAAFGPHSGGGNGQQAGMAAGRGDMLQTQDRLQLHVDVPDGSVTPAGDMQRDQDRLQLHVDMPDVTTPQVMGAVAWLPDGATIDSVTRDVSIDGTTKTVTATFAVTLADGSQTEIQRVHVFEQQSDGSWLLTSAPDCPNR